MKIDAVTFTYPHMISFSRKALDGMKRFCAPETFGKLYINLE